MDYQNHHQQHQQQQWRPRPPPQATANACPTCSFPHFPFCPPNPSSSHQPPSGFQFHRPIAHPRPFGQPPYELGGNGFATEGDRSYKRPRVDDFGFGSEDERRLRLIRDHGAGLSPNSSAFDPRSPYLQQQGVHNPYSRFYGHHQPPLPASPPPPLPMDPPLHAAARNLASLFPVGSPGAFSSPFSGAQPMAQPYFHSKSFPHPSSGFATQDLQAMHGMLPKQFSGENRAFPGKPLSPDKPVAVDASKLFKQPHRATRPDHFVIILRGLPGSGKTYLAKMLRDIEVENGGTAPRIHSMDDYFMIEVEKVEESDHSKSSGSVRGKKPMVKTVMEYCYEPEMEEAYRSSMLRAFRKTLEEADYTFIIVDDRNLRKADFAQFWAIAKSSGYEVYILEASYKDPAGCAARNVHGFTLDDIQTMAGQWEEAPSFHLQLDAKSLFSGDDLKKSGILEVDMDMEDEDIDELPSESQENYSNNLNIPRGNTSVDASKDGKSRNCAKENATKVKELGRSKWSNDLDEDGTEQPITGNINALSGLIQAYNKEAKSVRWGDKGGNSGFAIKAAKKAISFSLEIGPGSGYNLKSNPLPEESGYLPRKNGEEPKSVFQEQLRAECESFKAVFFKKQQRVGLDYDDE